MLRACVRGDARQRNSGAQVRLNAPETLASATCPRLRHVLGSTPHPNDAFVVHAFRGLASDADVLRQGRILVCHRDPKWSYAMEEVLSTIGVRVVRTPAAAPNCNA